MSGQPLPDDVWVDSDAEGPVCPFCGVSWQAQSPEDYEPLGHESDCHKCGNRIEVTADYSVTWMVKAKAWAERGVTAQQNFPDSDAFPNRTFGS